MSFVPSALRSTCAPHLLLSARTSHTRRCVTTVCRDTHASSPPADTRSPAAQRSFSTTPTVTRSLLSNASKGKQRWDSPSHSYACAPRSSGQGLNVSRIAKTSPLDAARIHRQPSSARGFHATARREALPLLPALGVFFKGTTILGLATGSSRVLISFFPIGTLATLRMARGVTWLEKDKRVPDATHDAEEFWKMWCEDERPIRVKPQEVPFLVNSPQDEHGGYVLPNGRVAYSAPMPRSWKRKIGDGKSEPQAQKRAEEYKLKWVGFFLPPLPPASKRSYSDSKPEEQQQVEALRRYYCSLRSFKDQSRNSRLVVATSIGIPISLLCLVWSTGSERVPLTGRWRSILSTPEDEEAVSTSLEGANWFKSVIASSTTPEAPAPPILPLNDWRWGWAQRTLRHLENECVAEVFRVTQGDTSAPKGKEATWPPPPEYPLLPRARASARSHAASPGGDKSGQEHFELGPPYSLMSMESPEKNAFSYGFGANGAGGIVLYTGSSDDIMAHNGSPPPPPPKRSWLASLFLPPPQQPTHPTPSQKQDSHLATVLAHEMAHLLLSHHLETLSHQQVLWPSVLGLSMDMIRAFIWPFTIFLGPTVNDALASVGRTTTEEMSKSQFVGFDKEHEYEADLLALRLLAIAGYDPKEAVEDFAGSIAQLDEMQSETERRRSWWSLFKSWNNSHPSVSERVGKMRDELRKWDTYRLEHPFGDGRDQTQLTTDRQKQ